MLMCPGRSYSVFSQRMLNQCLESLVQKIQSGVVIKFEKTGPDPPPLEGKRLFGSSLLLNILSPSAVLHVINTVSICSVAHCFTLSYTIS